MNQPLRRTAGSRQRTRLGLEMLEERRVLATFMVVNTDDAGPGSLRYAIEQANADALPDRIEFAIPGTGPHTIAPLSGLPSIDHPLTVDGYSQPGASPNTEEYFSNAVIMIELDGSNAGPVNGLTVGGDNTLIQGLAIHGFAGPNGIQIVGTDNVVAGNFIGTNASGTAAGLGNGENGVALGNTHSNRVGTDADGVNDLGERNVIVGHPSSGLRINGNSQFNVVAGNFIGVDATGSNANGNASGVLLFAGASQNVIGGAGVAGNVISGNTRNGITIGSSGFSSHQNLVHGNLIGTDASGTSALPNAFEGIIIGSGSVDNELHSNVISGNGRNGVRLDKVGVDGTRIIANLIGTNRQGNSQVGNGSTGIDVSFGPSRSVIRQNVISGNGGSGIAISGTSAGVASESTIVTGNVIGAGADGNLAIPNAGAGIAITDAAHTRIGSNFDGVDDAAEANRIVYNQLEGVRIADSGPGLTAGNTVRGNSIYANGQLGIELFDGVSGVTANDVGDADAGPNGLQNYPVINTAESMVFTTRVIGTLESIPSSTFVLDFYASADSDPSGFGEGQRFLGSTSVITDAAGLATYDVTLAATSTVGEILSATATEVTSGNTSEFSAALASTPPAVIHVEIDVKPGNDDNQQNVGANGVLPVAILTTTSFNAADVDPTSVIFAGASVAHFTFEDVDGDGDIDLLMHFRIQETNLAEIYAAMLADDLNADGVLDSSNQVAEVSLTGLTHEQHQIEGTDQVDLFLRGRALRDVLDQIFGRV